MMERLHKAANSWVFKGILVIIIVSLLLAGVGDYLVRSQGDYVAIVNGTKISRAKFDQAYQEERQRLQAQLGDSFSSWAADSANFSHIRQQTLSKLIDYQLLENYFKKLGLRLSDESVKAHIRKHSQFQKDGHFDNTRYLALLARNNITPEIFSTLARHELLFHQLMSALLGSEFVLPKESNALFSVLAQQREVRLATLAIEPLMAQQSVSAQEVKNYYDQHPNEFITPEQIKVNYLTFSATALQAAIRVSEGDIQLHYQQHPQRYSQAARQNISIIRVPTEQQATTLLAELQKPGSDFASLAKAHSTDRLTADKGGVLGWVTAGTTLPVFEQAAFALKKPGELSPVVRAEDGYYLLKLHERQPQKLKPLKKVRTEIVQLLRQHQAVEQFNLLQRRVGRLLDEHPDSLTEVAAAIGATVEQIPLFSRETIPPALDFIPLVNELFGDERIQSGHNSEIINVGNDQAFIVQVEQRQAAARQPLEQVQLPIDTLIKREKSLKLARQRAEELLLALRSEDGVSALRGAGLVWGKKQMLTRQSPDYTLTEVVFSHPKPIAEQPSYGVTENAQGDIVLFELLKVIAGNDPKGHTAFSADLLTHMAGVAQMTLKSSLYQHANIKLVNLDKLDNME